MHNNTVTTLQ